jgi:hypothetical protein
MTEQIIDRDKLRVALRKLRNEEIYYILGEALEMLPPVKLQKLIKGYFDLSQLRPDGHKLRNLLEEVKAFEQASLRGDYYESFDVNSKNCTQLSQGTRAWIFEFNRLLSRCIAAAKKGDKSETREAIEICFGLLRHIDECLDDVIFFADEGGSWQVGVDWDKVLPAYFVCLSSTAQPEEYAARVIGIVDEFQHYARDRHLSAARRVGTPSQRQALQKRLNTEDPRKKAGVL